MYMIDSWTEYQRLGLYHSPLPPVVVPTPVVLVELTSPVVPGSVVVLVVLESSVVLESPVVLGASVVLESPVSVDVTASVVDGSPVSPPLDVGDPVVLPVPDCVPPPELDPSEVGSDDPVLAVPVPVPSVAVDELPAAVSDDPLPAPPQAAGARGATRIRTDTTPTKFRIRSASPARTAHAAPSDN